MTRTTIRILKCMTFALGLNSFAVPAGAVEIAWDGATYLRIPVKIGSDTRLVMPEPFDDAWEHDDQVSATLLDARTLIIRPRTPRVEQRLTLRGRSSGTLYLARVSSSLPYTPLVKVQAGGPGLRGAADAPGETSVTSLLKAMMLGAAPAGFKVEKSSRVLLDQTPFRIVAEQVWQSARQAGVIARLHSTLPKQQLPLVPAQIKIGIAQLGSLRAMAADDYLLGPDADSTRVYLVYAR
jgi:hypothetical protein